MLLRGHKRKKMIDLFTESVNEGGFRLETLEIFNWGGFDSTIWRLQPAGQNSLITGANGSGKTTVVDALVSLLVPPRSRHYNQSSGNDRRRDRNEDSYVRGAFGTTRDEGSHSSRIRYHRANRKSAVSVLLASFTNSLIPDPICLVQVRWYGGASGRMETRYIIARKSLSIADDFARIDPRGEYLRRLKKEKNVEVFDTFTSYAKVFSRRFGMRSEKALTLFNKTVGVKNIDDLNEFIRTQMLDDVETEEEFTKLKTHYDDLLKAHRQIELAEARINLLEDVERCGNEYTKRLDAYISANEALDAIQPVVASIRRELALKEEEILGRSFNSLEARLEWLSSKLKEKRNAATEIQVALSSHRAMVRMREIEHQLEKNRIRQERVKSDYEIYAADAAKAGLDAPSDDKAFKAQQKILDVKSSQAHQKEEELESQKLSAGSQLERTRELSRDIQDELLSLEGRSSNIPRRSLDLRNRITHALGWDNTRLPFAGELMRLRQHEEHWRLAVDRLLHSFSLSLLVSEDDYRELTDYVNIHDMKGRVIYYKVRNNLSAGIFDDEKKKNPDVLFQKIEVKSDSSFAVWIEDFLADRFSYLCTDDPVTFGHSEYAVTSKGLVKAGGIRHEKDDRPNRYGPGHTVMGWDNREKIVHLTEELKKTEEFLSQNEAGLHSLSAQLEHLRDIRVSLERLATFRDFVDIDWFSIEAECGALGEQLIKLRESDDELRTLKTSLELIESEIQNCEDEQGRLQEDKGRMNQRMETVQKERHAAEELLKQNSQEMIHDALKRFRETLGEPPEAGNLGELRHKESVWSTTFKNRVQDCTERLSPAQNALSRAMGRFLRPSSDILSRFLDWNSVTSHLHDEITYLPEFITLLNRLRDEDLPGFKERFREYMNRRMSESLVGFSTLLDSTDRNIETYIRDLNKSLKELPYDQVRNTYIAINKEANTDPVIRDFRTMLKGSHPDQGRLLKDDIQELEAAFARIRGLIERLDEDQNWRRKVLDVRNWSRFSAGEYFRDDDTLKQYYEASGSLSGGEKAKLAYTILASALAYQYGLRKDSTHSFRFIVVDEIFSKVDPRNAEYAMELFNSLNLQVMVVTPLDNIRLVENYIHTVHFTERVSGDLARIHDISIEDVRERRSEGQKE